MILRGAGLDWTTDGHDWPNRQASRFIEAGGLRWHVQTMGPADVIAEDLGHKDLVPENLHHGGHIPAAPVPAAAAAPVLLLVHGTGSATHSWRALMPLLARDFTVIAMDLPSHAFTEAPAFFELSLKGMARHIEALLEALNVAPRFVVGHSAGAAILARLCLDGAIAPRACISLNGALLPFPGMAGHLFPGLAKVLFANPLTAHLMSRSADPARVERLLADTGSTIDAEGLKLYTRLFANSRHVSGALGMMAQWRLHELVDALPRLQPHLLLIGGGRDRAIDGAEAARVAALVPGSQALVLDRLGHLAHEEDPDRVASIITTFFSAAGAAQGGSVPPRA